MINRQTIVCRSITVLIVLWSLSGCQPTETVVVYSPHGADMLGDYKNLFEVAYPEVTVQWLDMGSQEVYSRINAERGRPACDIWWGGPNTMFTQASREGLLAVYRPEWADLVPAGSHDPENRWFPTHLSPLAILYNDRGLRPDEVPDTWDALLAPEWKGRITLRRMPPSGTMRTFICAMIARQDSVESGLDWLAQLHAHTVAYPESPHLLFDHLKKNDTRISVWLMPDIIMQRMRNGYPFAFKVPPGTPVLTEGIAIIEGAPNRDWAEKFYDFVTSREAMIHQAEAYAKLPARGDIAPEDLPEFLSEQAIIPMEFDWDYITEVEAEWVRRWQLDVFDGGRS